MCTETNKYGTSVDCLDSHIFTIMVMDNQSTDKADWKMASTINVLKLATKQSRQTVQTQIRPQGYKTFLLNSAEHEVYPAHKC